MANDFATRFWLLLLAAGLLGRIDEPTFDEQFARLCVQVECARYWDLLRVDEQERWLDEHDEDEADELRELLLIVERAARGEFEPT
jgi:hypothetical protein